MLKQTIETYKDKVTLIESETKRLNDTFNFVSVMGYRLRLLSQLDTLEGNRKLYLLRTEDNDVLPYTNENYAYRRALIELAEHQDKHYPIVHVKNDKNKWTVRKDYDKLLKELTTYPDMKVMFTLDKTSKMTANSKEAYLKYINTNYNDVKGDEETD